MQSSTYCRILNFVNVQSLVFIFLFSLEASQSLLAQDTFQKEFKRITFSEMIRTSDGGFACSGWGKKDTLQGSVLLKLNEVGDTIWSRYYIDTTSSLAHSVFQTSDGGFILTGKQYHSNIDTTNILLIRTDSIGQILWVKRLGKFFYENGRNVKETPDGGLIITGERNRDTSYVYDMFATKTDAEGNVEWSKSYMGPGNSQGFKILVLSDGSYIVHGIVNIGTENPDILTIRLTADGDTIWTRSYGSNGYERSYNLIETAQHQLAIIGLTNSWTAGYGDIYLTLLDLDGNLLWSKVYGGSGGEEGHSITQTVDGGFIFGGYANQGFDIETGLYVVKTNSAGEVQWSMTYHDNDVDNVTAIAELVSGEYLVAGHSRNFLKINKEGITGCDEQNVQTITSIAGTEMTHQPIQIASLPMSSLPYHLKVKSGFDIEATCKGLSTQNAPSNSKFHVSPNPAQDIIQIELIDGLIHQLQVVDISGRLVFKENHVEASQLELNIHDFPPGIYILLAETDEGWVRQKLAK
ncbi:MAG TPA: T9SS type A sorting domain-containing protein [Saprospiraceae bacterium]|nr:T9SS type A sorting domain-containing protein [Saprospiraceae bacterium]